MKVKRPSPAMVVALIALVMSTTGGALAAVNYARNAGAVDGKSAVKASSSNKKAARKLVATNSSGQIPFKFLADAASASDVERLSGLVARGRNGTLIIPVADNAETAAQTLVNLELGNLNVSCFDQQDQAGKENAATRVTITNHSGAVINLARRVGLAQAVIESLENNVVNSFVVGTQETFEVQMQGGGNKTVLIEGTARQAGQGTPESACGVWATAIFVE